MRRERPGRGARIAILLASALTAGCAAGDRAAGESEPDGGVRASSDRAVPVRTRVVEGEAFTETFEVTGTVRPWREYALAAEFGGTVGEVEFDRGDAVEAGQPLARIGTDLARAALEQARAERMASEANFEKVSRLAERDAVPMQDLVAATARRDRDRAAFEAARIRLERSEIRSPARGKVVARYVDPGEVVSAGAPVATIHEIDRLKVEAAVPDTEISWLRVGGAGRVRVDAWGDARIDGRIRYVAPAADPVTRTFDVEMEIPGSGGRIRPGMVVRVELVRPTVEAAVVVPLDALIARVDGTSAFVVEDCRAVRRKVVPGGTESGRVRIVEGLAAGDRLVVEGQRDLADGQRVTTETCR